jgi:hypothetical protein
MNLQSRKLYRERQARLDDIEDRIIKSLPETLPVAPTISNIQEEVAPLEPRAWLSFSCPSYDPDNTWNPVDILKQLERGSFKTVPASLCKWDNYRHYPEFGYWDSIPDIQNGKN